MYINFSEQKLLKKLKKKEVEHKRESELKKRKKVVK